MSHAATSAAQPHAGLNGFPRHVAIIMDGNGRWAKARHLPRSAGHKRGVDSLRAVMTACRDRGIHYLTVYAFSAENWKRPQAEVAELMQLLKYYLHQEVSSLHENGVRLRVIGERQALPSDVRALIADAESLTSANTAFHLTVGLSYGSRQEIAQAARRLAEEAAAGRLDPRAIDEDVVAHALYTGGLPEPDLLIRTGGEQRLSNFLLWQSAYTELYFTPVLWPEFTVTHFEEAMDAYSKRERRYGGA